MKELIYYIVCLLSVMAVSALGALVGIWIHDLAAASFGVVFGIALAYYVIDPLAAWATGRDRIQ